MVMVITPGAQGKKNRKMRHVVSFFYAANGTDFSIKGCCILPEAVGYGI